MTSCFCFIFFLLSASIGFAQNLKELEATRVHLPNGWSITPAGDKLLLGDLPLNIAVSNNGDYIAVTNNGQSTQSIMMIDAKNRKANG